jgi:hypothetical protein
VARHRTFGNSQPADGSPAPEPVTFDLSGGPPLSAEEWEETFTCLPVAPAGVLDDFVNIVSIDARGNRVYDAPSLLNFLKGVLVDEDVDRLNALVHDKRRVVELATLGEVVMWLSQELLGRPTMPPSS